MTNTTTNTGSSGRPRSRGPLSASTSLSVEHYIHLVWHRKWLVLGAFVAVTGACAFWTSRLPNIYSSETLILVDPQKVPESYVKSTVTGDVKGRLGTLSTQILSATRLQKIIDSLNLYPKERKTFAREDVIGLMRKEITVSMVSDFGGGQDLQAFKIRFTGRDPRQVAHVANELASLFIDENLKAREMLATGTSEFLQNQLQQARKTLETQESKLRDFRMKHIGQMPEQQTANLQILGQLQSQLRQESEALAQAEREKRLLEAMKGQAPVVDLDPVDQRPALPPNAVAAVARPASKLAALKAHLEVLQTRFFDQHPDVRKQKQLIQEEEARSPGVSVITEPAAPAAVSAQAPVVTRRGPLAPGATANPVLQSNLRSIEQEIAKRKEQEVRLNQQISMYQARLEAIPVREQQMTELVRDYELSKAHYGGLLTNSYSAETATQLEIRQKGEKFSVLDAAQPAERPSSPNRRTLNAGGAVAGLALGLMLALLTEFLGISITAPEQISEGCGIPILEVIPVFMTHADRRARKKKVIWAVASGVAITVISSFAAVVYHYRS